MRIIYQRILICCVYLLPALAFAAYKPAGIGQVATNMLEPVYLVSNFVSSASIIIGASSLFGAFLKYLQYRVNPLAAPMSTVLILFFMGLLLLVLPLVYKLTESGVPFHIM